MTARRARRPRAPGRTQAPRAAIGSGTSEGIVAVLDKRGRFHTAEPFFERGGRMIVERDTRAKIGDLVLVRPASRSGGHAKIVRTLGSPDVAGDVLEALMLDRGLRRRFDPAVERAAKKARDAGTGPHRSASRPHAPDDVHDRPGHRARLRRRDLRRGAARAAARACGCTSPTSARSCPPARSSTARRRGARRASTSPGASSRCCPRRSPTTPARSSRPRSARRSRSSSTSTARASRARASTARRSAPTRGWTTSRSIASSPAMRRRRSRGPRRWPPRALCPPRCTSAAWRSPRSSWRRASPSFASTSAATSPRRARASRPSRTA